MGLSGSLPVAAAQVVFCLIPEAWIWSKEYGSEFQSKIGSDELPPSLKAMFPSKSLENIDEFVTQTSVGLAEVPTSRLFLTKSRSSFTNDACIISPPLAYTVLWWKELPMSVPVQFVGASQVVRR